MVDSLGPILPDGGRDGGSVAADVDGVDHGIADRGHGAGPVPVGMAGPDLVDLSAESSGTEAVGVRVDDRVREEVPSGLLGRLLQ